MSYSYNLSPRFSSKHDCISEKQEKTLKCSDSFTKWVSVFNVYASLIIIFDNADCDGYNLNIITIWMDIIITKPNP